MTRLCVRCKSIFGCVIGQTKHLCASCGSVQNPCPTWVIQPDTLITHGICPSCYPQYYKEASNVLELHRNFQSSL